MGGRVSPGGNGSTGDPAQVYRNWVHWSRWESIPIFPLSRAKPYGVSIKL